MDLHICRPFKNISLVVQGFIQASVAELEQRVDHWELIGFWISAQVGRATVHVWSLSSFGSADRPRSMYMMCLHEVGRDSGDWGGQESEVYQG